ncbi:MAG: SufD family Fe-S cluster assembly protein [Firmicutes bacterium]|nr:SufD family Fe-S cluster assembly protein [Bacillota bacterium]
MTANTNSVIVNRLPALTWNRLGVNRAHVDLSRLPEVSEEAVFKAVNTEQVKTEKKPTVEASAWADGYTQGIRRENSIAGKTAIYQEQAFATGLGGDYTELIGKMVPETDIFTVEENQKLDKPVILTWDFGSGAKAAAQQIIHAGKGSESTFLLNYHSERAAEGHAAIETKVILEEGAVVHLMKVNLLGSGFVLLDDSAAVVGEKASFDFVQMELGCAKTYTGCYADQAGDESAFTVNTGYMADQDHLMDINYVAAQRGKNTDSRIYVKGSLRDRAAKVFRGTIDFRKGSKGSVGDEQEDVLIFDPGVVNKTVPVILTEEEEVDGRHGATIGNLSEEIMFYLGTRGIAKADAEMLMTRGRLLSVAHMIPDDETVEKISAFIEEAFGK